MGPVAQNWGRIPVLGVAGAPAPLIWCLPAGQFARAMVKAAHWTVSGARDLPIAQASSWDGSAAAKALLDHAGIGGSSPNHELARRGFVFCDTANPDERGSYKDPFAVIEGGALKASSAGIRALESFVPRTDVPAELKKSAAALVAHYKSKISGDEAKASGVYAAALAAAENGSAPAWVQLFPKGEVAPQDGRAAWKLSDPDAVIAASKLPALIDFDHGAARKVEDGQDSSAAGWIEELSARGPNGEPGLWARIAWTPRGAEAIASKTYRYISPWFLHSKSTREVTKVMGAGLVNVPALDLPALASIQPSNEEHVEELLTKLRSALNLPDNASADDVVSAITAMRSNSNALCSAAGFTKLGDTEVAAICAKLKNPASDPDQQKQIDDLQKQVATLTATMRGNTAAAEVDGAIKSGKLAPAQRDWAVEYASRDPAGFKTFIGKQPTILATGRIAGEAAAEGSLTDEERAICAALHLTEDQFKAEKNRQSKH